MSITILCSQIQCTYNKDEVCTHICPMVGLTSGKRVCTSYAQRVTDIIPADPSICLVCRHKLRCSGKGLFVKQCDAYEPE